MILKNLNLSKFKEKTLYIFIAILSIIVSINAFINPQLHGEDEATTFITSVNLLNNLKNFEVFNFLKSLIAANHPPGRYLLPIPFLEIFGESIMSMRIPYFFLWIGSCVLSTKIALKIGGKANALLTGIFLSTSGLFNLEVQSLSHGASVFFGLLLSNEILKNEIDEDYINKKFELLKINILLLLGFIFFTTWSVIIFGFYLYLIINYYKKKKLISNTKNLFFLTYPFLFFYILYYLVFLGFPYWIINLNGLEVFNQTFNQQITIDYKSFGQLHQYYHRANVSLNLSSFIDNIKTINWAYMPLVGPILFFLGIFNVYKKHKNIFFMIILYFFLFSFYFSGNTGQHIQTLFIILFAFSINELITSFKNKKLLTYFVFTKLVFLILITYNFHIKIYNEKNYPYNFEKIFFVQQKWPQNLVRPLDKIVLTLTETLKKNGPILNLIDGPVSLYHGRKLKWIYKKDLEEFNLTKNNCYIFDARKYEAVVNSEKLPAICKNENLQFIEFENSYLYVVKIIKN